MTGIMVVMLMAFFMCDELLLVLWVVGPIFKNGCGVWGQDCNKIFHLTFVTL